MLLTIKVIFELLLIGRSDIDLKFLTWECFSLNWFWRLFSKIIWHISMTLWDRALRSTQSQLFIRTIWISYIRNLDFFASITKTFYLNSFAVNFLSITLGDLVFRSKQSQIIIRDGILNFKLLIFRFLRFTCKINL